jgi:glycerol uptake facilitator protein
MKGKTLIPCLAEFLGTFIFVSIGFASVAAMVLKMSDVSYPFMAVCWGGAITIAIYIVGGVSGAHLNPAVTAALVVWDGFDKKKAVCYIISQILGAFCAAAIVYYLFSSGINEMEEVNGWVRGTAEGTGAMGIFVTGAAAGVSMFKAFINETIITAMLVLTIYAVTDKENVSAPEVGIGDIAIGAIVIFCGIAFGPLTGFAMNPARDFGPRLFVMIAGWGKYALGSDFYGLIVPIFGPFLGGILGGGVYKKVIKPLREKI